MKSFKCNHYHKYVRSLITYWEICFVSFRSPSLFYLLFTVGVEVVYFHLITLRHTPQSVGLLWTSDRPVAETSTWQHKHCTRKNIYAPCGIRTHDPSKRWAADLRLRQRGHWDRREIYLRVVIFRWYVIRFLYCSPLEPKDKLISLYMQWQVKG
jgi:hypothetical protein